MADGGSDAGHPGQQSPGDQVVRGLADGYPGDLVGGSQFQLRGNQITFFIVTQINLLQQIIFYLFVLGNLFL